MGSLSTSAEFLLEVLGRPNSESLDGKTTMEWVFETPAGVAVLYDYKWRASRHLSTVEQWSIGGLTDSVVPHVKDYLRTHQHEILMSRASAAAEEKKQKEPQKVHLWTSVGNSPNAWTKCGSGARSARNFDSSKVTCKTCAKIAAKQNRD